MRQDSHASDQEGASLSEEHLALYQFFYDSRNRHGTPKVTRSYAQQHFNWSWEKTGALMREIEDAGYWKIADNGTPFFFPDRVPPRPKPVWLEDSLTHMTQAAERPAVSECGELLTTRRTSHSRNPFGVTAGPRPAPTNPGWLNPKSRRVVFDLVDYFNYRVRKQFHGLSPHPMNDKAVGAEIRHWVRRDGIHPATVKLMIDIFTEQKLRGDVPAWKSFLALRQKLFTMAQERSSRQEDDDYWQRRIEEAGT
jgi:hypothetical protein